jgi:hypothetical protein
MHVGVEAAEVIAIDSGPTRRKECLQMARSKGVHELADPSQRQTQREQACCAAEHRLAAECTFQPDTRKPVIPDVQYMPAKAAFSVHDQDPENLVQRCDQPLL